MDFEGSPRRKTDIKQKKANHCLLYIVVNEKEREGGRKGEKESKHRL